MASKTIKGLTVEIGGDTTKLGDALEKVNKKSRDLSSELGEINKLLKMDPKNTDLLAQKQKVLSQAIATTADKLKTLKEAEKQVQKQFEKGEVSEDQVRALQREIIATEKKMESYEKATKETGDQLEKFGKHTEDAEGKTHKFGAAVKTVGSAAVKGLAAVAAAAAAAAAGLANAAVEAAAYADNILTASTVTGISTEKLQEYSYAAELVDVSVETLTKSHAKNIKSMKAVQDGTALAVEAYKKLGVEVMNADGTLRDGETVYWEVIDALGKMENETERDALAMQILGKSAQELNPLIEAGSEKMAELAQEAHEVGAVLSEDSLDAMGAFDDSLQRLKGSTGAAKNALGSVLLPELTTLATEGSALISEFTKNLNESGGGLDGFVQTLDEMAPMLAEKATSLVTGLLDKVTTLAPAIITVGAEILTQLTASLIEMTPQLIETGITLALSLIDGLSAALPEILRAYSDMIPKLVDVLTQGTPLLIEGAVTLLMAIVDAVGLLLPPLIKALPRIVMCLVETLTKPEMLNQLIQGALQLLLAICDAIPLLIEQLAPLIPQIITTIISNLLDATPQLIQAAFTLLSAIGKAIPKACVALLKSLPQIWKTMKDYFSKLPEKLGKIGGELIAGLWKGIKDKNDWLKKKITGWVGDVTGWLKKLFDINSPSGVTAWMGEMLDEGLAVGIEGNASAPKKAMSDLASDVLDELGAPDGMAIERQINHSYTVSAAAATAQNASLIGKLDQILQAIERGQVITLDGNALVGGTVNAMNNALGQRRILAERGAY